MSFILEDSSSNLWSISVNDGGFLISTEVGSGSPITLYLNDLSESTSWLVTVTTDGNLETIEQSLGAHPTSKLIVSQSGLTAWNLEITVDGILETVETVVPPSGSTRPWLAVGLNTSLRGLRK